MSGYLAGAQLLLQELGRPGADALQDQLLLRDLDVRGFQKLQQRLGVVEMPLDRSMEAGLAAESGQPICNTAHTHTFSFSLSIDFRSESEKFLTETKQEAAAVSFIRLPDETWYPCKRRRRNAIAHVAMSSMISSSLASQDLQFSNSYIGSEQFVG